jgi:hypothetical protein
MVDGYKVSEKEFYDALAYKKKRNRRYLEREYNKYELQQKGYPEFDKLYSEIEQECKEFYNNEENRQKYIRESYQKYKSWGFSEEKIKGMNISDRFKYSSIEILIGETTKYGNEYKNYFWHFYNKVGQNLDIENDKIEYCLNNGKNPVEQVPQELKEYLIRYEASFYNEVTAYGGLIINYYFYLNNKTKEYLLKFKSDFDLEGLEDLAIYKGDDVEFYSCTHEKFNSLE